MYGHWAAMCTVQPAMYGQHCALQWFSGMLWGALWTEAQCTVHYCGLCMYTYIVYIVYIV